MVIVTNTDDYASVTPEVGAIKADLRSDGGVVVGDS
jgi:hypothetical protein